MQIYHRVRIGHGPFPSVQSAAHFPNHPKKNLSTHNLGRLPVRRVRVQSQQEEERELKMRLRDSPLKFPSPNQQFFPHGGGLEVRSGPSSILSE